MEVNGNLEWEYFKWFASMKALIFFQKCDMEVNSMKAYHEQYTYIQQMKYKE